jgi:hypothetical protein
MGKLEGEIKKCALRLRSATIFSFRSRSEFRSLSGAETLEIRSRSERNETIVKLNKLESKKMCTSAPLSDHFFISVTERISVVERSRNVRNSEPK